MFSVVSLSSTKNKMMKKGTEYLFKYIKTAPDQKNFLIEPMCCLIRLGILNFKDRGTKVCIYDNSISYYEPTIIQGILRTWNGDNREDLHNLFNPIIVALRWFDPSIPFYRGFFVRCRKGIIKLKSVYETNSIIHHTLNHYIRTITEHLEKKPEKIPLRMETSGRGIHVSFDVDDDDEKASDITNENLEYLRTLEKEFGDDEAEDKSDKSDLDKPDLSESTIKNEHINFIEVFKDLWSENELNIVNSTFNQLTDIQNSTSIRDEYQRKEIMKTYLNSIELIVRQKEKQVQSIIFSTITTY